MTDTNQSGPDAVLRAAVALQNAGRLPEAANLYRELVRQFPQHLQLLNVLGTLELQMGEAKKCVLLLGRSLGFNPNQPGVLFNRGLGLMGLGCLDEAMDSFEKAVALDPSDIDVWRKLADVQARLGKIMPSLESFSRIIAMQPQSPAGYYDRGTILLRLGRPAEALADFDRALKIRPDYLEAHVNRGTALMNRGRLEESLAAFDAAIALVQGCAPAHLNRGRVLEKLGRGQDALTAYDTAALLDPNDAAAHYNRACLLVGNREYEEALAALDKAVALEPRHGEAYNNRGNVLISLGRLEDALASLDRAIALNPKNAEAYTNRGNVLRELARPDEALASYDRAIALSPDYAEAQANKSISLLQAGNFAEGFKLYEYRWKCEVPRRAFLNFSASMVRHFDQSAWLGREDIAGKTLLVHAEQGLGDSIQFCRYIPLLKKTGARLLFEVPDALRSLMGSLKTDAELVGPGSVLPPFDWHTPLMSLPLIFGTKLDTVPADVPYLAADKAKTILWRRMLGEKQRPRIGLAWSGNPEHTNDHNRSIPLEILAPLLRLPFSFYALQKDIRPADARLLAAMPELKVQRARLDDFSDTAALVEQMDLVISVDTSVAHLAGALGKPVWLMLTAVAEWRWLVGRDDSPWYPSARLLRQENRGDWPGLIQTIADRLMQGDFPH
ncbi:MAG: tetratricopeptide repeat protein [Rhizomicrobium sp.]